MDAVAIIEEYDTVLLLDYFQRSMGALLAYEYLLTVTEEWTLLWKQRRWTGMTWLFLATRLYMLTTVIDTFAPPTEQTYGSASCCAIEQKRADFAIPGVFSALRVYALTSCNIFVTCVVVLLSCLPIGLNIFTTFYEGSTSSFFSDDPILGPICERTVILPDWLNLTIQWYAEHPFIRAHTIHTHHYLGSFGTRLAVIIVDIIVVAVTWRKTYQLYKQAAQLGIHTRLGIVLLRDGSFDFVILLFLNFALLLNETWADSDGATPHVMAPVNGTMQLIIVSRFIINLKQAGDNPDLSSATCHISHLSHLAFRTPTSAGDIGDADQPFEVGGDEDEEMSIIADFAPAKASTSGGDIDVLGIATEIQKAPVGPVAESSTGATGAGDAMRARATSESSGEHREIV